MLESLKEAAEKWIAAVKAHFGEDHNAAFEAEQHTANTVADAEETPAVKPEDDKPTA